MMMIALVTLEKTWSISHAKQFDFTGYPFAGDDDDDDDVDDDDGGGEDEDGVASVCRLPKIGNQTTKQPNKQTNERINEWTK